MLNRASKTLGNMNHNKNIDDLLSNWEFHPDLLNVRLIKGSDGRDVIQMRVDLGVLQLETTGRPDGIRRKASPII